MTKTTLYRHFCADDRLLYVGITDCMGERNRQHALNSPWYSKVARTEIQECLSRSHAEALERVAVQFEKPLHNITHSLPAFQPPQGATADLLRDVLDFCARKEMPPTAFGMAALGDPGFVRNLHEGREVRSKTMRRVVEFMEAAA